MMDKVEIRDDQLVSMDAIAPGLHGLRITFVNVFGVEHPDGGWTLVDAAIPYSAAIIKRWAEKKFGRGPRAIVLTHGHFDHVSAAAELSREWNVPVYAHRLEFPYLTGEREYPKPNVGAGGGMMSLLSPLYPRGPVDLRPRLEELGAEVSEAVMPRWKLLETPGHTPGHVSFWREEDRVLIPGDAFCTTKPESFFEAALAQKPEVHGPPSYFTSDWNAAGASVRKLAGLNAEVVAPGHGRPMAGAGVAEALRELADRFGEVAVPENVKHEAA
jgi:glyoxylase-like metal-dependent hydrolase (beta-lactamase superfamily II)